MHPYAPFAVHAKPNTQAKFAVNAGSFPARTPAAAVARLGKSFMQGSVRTAGSQQKSRMRSSFTQKRSIPHV